MHRMLIISTLLSCSACGMHHQTVRFDNPDIKASQSKGPVALSFRSGDVTIKSTGNVISSDSRGKVRSLVAKTLRGSYNPSAPAGLRARVHVLLEGPETGLFEIGVSPFKEIKITVTTTLPSGETITSTGERQVDEESTLQRNMVLPAIGLVSATGLGTTGAAILSLVIFPPLALSLFAVNCLCVLPSIAGTAVLGFVNLYLASNTESISASNLLVQTLESHAVDLSSSLGSPTQPAATLPDTEQSKGWVY